MKLRLGNQEIEITEEQRQKLIEALNPTESCSLNSPEKADSWPRENEEFWTIEPSEHNDIVEYTWFGSGTDKKIKSMGLVFRTEEEAKAHVRYLKALTRVKGSSSFVPNWNENNQKYFVRYNHKTGLLAVDYYWSSQSIGAPVYYESIEAAEQAIKDHKEDFLILAGVK